MKPVDAQAGGPLSAEVLRILKAPGAGRPFLAGLDETWGGKRVLTVHASRASMTARQARDMRRQLRSATDGLRVRISRHHVWTLQRARSLEVFLKPFAHQQIVFDPTGVFDRGRRLVDFVGLARRTANRAVRKVLWHSPTGSLFVVLDQRQLPQDAVERSSRLTAIRDALRRGLGGALGEGSFVRTLRLGFGAPSLPTTPVDADSAEIGERVLTRLGRKAWVSSIAASLGLGAVVAKAQDGTRAVSGPNGELAIMGGVREGDPAFLVEGAVAVPLGDRFGARWDGAAGSVDGDFVAGGGAHLFWRDPEIGLLGIAGGYLRAEDGALFGRARETGVLAGEAEAYLDQVTASGMAGYQFSEGASNDGFIGRVDLEWYPTDDLMLSPGIETNPQVDFVGRFGAEYRPGFEALPGLSFFAEGAFGDEGYERAFAGIRFYFGRSETLKARHRHDTFRSHLLPTRMIDGLPSRRISAYGE